MLLRELLDDDDDAGPLLAGALARGVALGPGGIRDQQRYPSNRRYVADTRCTWVRLWAEWPKLQPRASRPPDFRLLDSEIAAARADGVRVMLTSWRYPTWANASAPRAGDDRTFTPPRDLSPDSPFGRWMRALGERDVDAIEVVNEPNFQLQPQRDVHVAVARMLATAREVLPADRLLVSPATADRRSTGATTTDHLEFAEALLDELDRIGFAPDRRTAWSHHNYGDVESDGDERITAARALVGARWPGVPFLVTETGARLTTIARRERITDRAALRLRQAELITRAHQRLRLKRPGAPVTMVLHYLFITDANYDCGLCELDGRPRPAYHAWGALPS